MFPLLVRNYTVVVFKTDTVKKVSIYDASNLKKTLSLTIRKSEEIIIYSHVRYIH